MIVTGASAEPSTRSPSPTTLGSKAGAASPESSCASARRSGANPAGSSGAARAAIKIVLRFMSHLLYVDARARRTGCSSAEISTRHDFRAAPVTAQRASAVALEGHRRSIASVAEDRGAQTLERGPQLGVVDRRGAAR